MIKSVGRATTKLCFLLLLISRLNYMIWISNFLHWFSFFNALLLHTINSYFLTKNVLILPFVNLKKMKIPSWTIKNREKNHVFIFVYTKYSKKILTNLQSLEKLAFPKNPPAEGCVPPLRSGPLAALRFGSFGWLWQAERMRMHIMSHSHPKTKNSCVVDFASPFVDCCLSFSFINFKKRPRNCVFWTYDPLWSRIKYNPKQPS